MKDWKKAQIYSTELYTKHLSTLEGEERAATLLKYYSDMAIYGGFQKMPMTEVEDYALKALEAGKKITNTNQFTTINFCTLYSTLGAIEQKRMNEAQSYAYFLKDYEYERQLNNTHFYGFYNFPASITLYYIRQQQFEEAANWCQEATKLAEHMEKYNREKGAERIIVTYYIKGILAEQEKDKERNQFYYEKAIDMLNMYPESRMALEGIRSLILSKLSTHYAHNKEFVKARNTIKEALSISLERIENEPQDVSTQIIHARNYLNKGSFEIELGNSQEAISDLKNAITYYTLLLQRDEEIYLRNILFSQLNLSSAYYMNGNIIEAEKTLNNISETATEAAQKYPEIYQPYVSITKLFKGVLYEKTKRTNQGEVMIMQALEEFKIFPDSPIVKNTIEVYKKGEVYRKKREVK